MNLYGRIVAETKKAVREYFNVTITGQQRLKDVCLIKFTNSDKTKGVTPEGVEVDTIPVGSPKNIDLGYLVGDKTYVVQRDKLNVQYVDGQSVNPYLLLSGTNGSLVTLEIVDVAQNLWAEVPLPPSLAAIPSETTAQDNWGFGFTPSEKHLVVWFYSSTTDSLKLTTSITGYWVFYPNFSVQEDPGSVTTEGTFSSDTPITGSTSLTSFLTQPADPEDIVWVEPNTYNLNGGGTVAIDLEDEPAYATEAGRVNLTYDWYPDETNDYDTSKASHSIFGVIYEALSNGETVPALDFVGELEIIKEKIKIKRANNVTANTFAGDNAAIDLTYSANGAETYYLDPDRMGNQITLVDNHDGYGLAAGSQTGFLSFYYDDAPTPINLNIFTTNNIAINDGPDCDDFHLAYVPEFNGGTTVSESIIYTGLGGAFPSTTWAVTQNYDRFVVTAPAVCTSVPQSTLINTSGSNRRSKVNRTTAYVSFYQSVINGSASDNGSRTNKTVTLEEGTTTIDGSSFTYVTSSNQSPMRSSRNSSGSVFTDVNNSRALILTDASDNELVSPHYTSLNPIDVNATVTAGYQLVFSPFYYHAVTPSSVLFNESDPRPVDSFKIISYSDVTIGESDGWRFKIWNYSLTNSTPQQGRAGSFTIPTRVIERYPVFPTFNAYMVY